MKEYDHDEDADANEEQPIDDEEIDTSEEGFIKGYAEDENVSECAECGSAIDKTKKISEEIDGENYVFCSKSCLEEFKESLG